MRVEAERDPLECVAATVEAVGVGFVVFLRRADGEQVPTFCATLDLAIELLQYMCPATATVDVRGVVDPYVRRSLIDFNGGEPSRVLH
jgi:UDP-N-acetyl-D-mannosaminuronic acid transferase (WecB/TagA/CpsF family)